jgi:hypothetical protein
MTTHLSVIEKVMVAGSGVAVVFSLFSIVVDFHLGIATIASALVVVLSTALIVVTLRGARARSSTPPAS